MTAANEAVESAKGSRIAQRTRELGIPAAFRPELNPELVRPRRERERQPAEAEKLRRGGVHPH